MRHILTRKLAVVALVVSSSLSGTPFAAGSPPTADGEFCNSVPGGTDLLHARSDSAELAVLSGGPVVAADLPDVTANPVSVTLICTIQAWPDTTHAGPDLASASASGTAVVVLPPTPVSFEDRGIYPGLWPICTELVVEDAHGGTYRLYWDHVSGGGANEFSTSPTASCFVGICDQSIPSNCDPPRCDDSIHLHCRPVPPAHELDDILFEDVVDPAACPAFAVLFPPGGDIPHAWDCPPYAS